ncbi:beta strand repeat-containing protein, partial [Azospirillum isscasi]
PSAAPPVTKALTSDPFAVAAQIQQQAARTVETAASALPSPVSPATPAAHNTAAPTLSASFDAAAFAKALAVAEGTAAPAGFAVFHLIEAMFRPGEAGSSVVGVAVVANPDSPLGVWQYSLDSSAWLAVGAVGDGSALVLPGSALLRFLPAAGAFGTAPPLGLRAVNDEWTEGFSGAGHRLFTLSGTGGTTPLSADIARLSLEVTPVNGTPVATGAQTVLAAVAEDSADPAGASVASLFGGLFSDPTDAVFGSAGNGFAGVAVVGNPTDATHGEWQYWTGTVWATVGAVSDGDALLLAADAMLRFLPAANWNGNTPALTVRLIDDSQGPVANGERADVTGTGGDSRYSAGTIALTTAVTAVNDAPVVTGTAATLPSIAEDTADPAGATVASLFGHLFSDAADAVSGGSASSALAGVVVVGNAAVPAQGLWQYWTGTAWTDIGAVSDSDGLLLAANTALRFLPAANWNGTTPALTVRLVEDGGAPVVAGSRVDLTDNVGGSTVYSAGTIALTGTVAAVNDAPVATGTTATLPSIAEDTANPTGATVTSLFGHLFSDTADAVTGGSAANGFAGVAVVANPMEAAQGEWQYWTGSDWAAVGVVSDGDALLLAADATLRFLPAANWNGTTPALTVRLVDDSQGIVTTGGRVALTAVGGDSRYSAGTVALTTAVSAVNDAPVATGTATTLPPIAEDTADPAGATVASLFGHLFSDAADAVSGGSASSALAGVVVVGNATVPAQGLWQYWTGTAWADIGAVSGSNGLLLAANTALRFLPAANWNGTTPALTVRLVEDGGAPVVAGSRVDLTDNVGGSTVYSAGTIALTGSVAAVNDAPVATGTTATLPSVAEDTANPAGATVTALFGHLFSDPNDAVTGGSAANGFTGIAIVGNAATTAQGAWQYWTGTAWIAVGTVTEGSALVVAAGAKLRFLPAADWNGTTPALTVRLIEDGGAPAVTGSRVNLTTGVGGSTVYGAETIALTGSVTPVNDAPQVTAGTAALTTVKGVAVAVTGLSVSDIDAGPAPLLVTLTAGHGALTLASAGWDAEITGNGTDSVTIRATLATINGLLGAANGLLYTASSYTGADSIRILVNDLGNGGAGGPLTASATIGVTVAPPNASPVLKDTNLDVTVAAEALAAPTAGTAGIAVSKLVGLNGAGPANVTDTDAGALTGIALTGTNESYGHWWFSTNNGATWSLVGTVNDSDSALLLRSTDRLYFQPNASVPATVNGALTIRAWDQTTGSAGTKAAVTTGAGSAFSAASDTVTLHPGVLVPNGSFDSGLTGWSYTGGATVGTTGDGREGTITSAGGKSPTFLEDFLGLAHGSIAAATGTVPSYGHAMKLATGVTVTKETTLTFDWSFVFSDPGYHDFAFVSVNGVVRLLAKDASASGKFSVVIPANSTLSLGFGTSDTSDNSVNPILRIDNIKLTTVASDPIVLDMTGDGLSLRALSEGVQFDVSGDGVADRTGWIGAGNALLVRDDNRNGRIDGGHELVSEHFGAGFNSSLEALASLDTNHDGRLDAADESFATLQVWQDADADGVSQPGELRTLAEAGIRAIGVGADASDATLAGNRVLGTTGMTMADGSSRLVAGVAFDVQAAPAAQVHSQPLAPSPQADQGRFDFAALLSSGLGLPDNIPPDNIPVVQNGIDAHTLGWSSTPHTPDTHDVTTHALPIVHVAENS